MVLLRQRVITFLGLTSLVAMMMMVTHYSSIVEQSTNNYPSPAKKRLQTPLPLASVVQQVSRVQLLDANKFKVIYLNKPVAHRTPAKKRLLVGGKSSTPLPAQFLQPSSSESSFRKVLPNSDMISLSNNVILDGNVNATGLAARVTPPTPLSTSSPSLIQPEESRKESVAVKRTQLNAQPVLDKQVQSGNHSAVKPKTAFTLEDLKSTERFVIDKPLFCDTDNGATLDLLVVVTSAVQHFEAREAIRQTWGAFAVERGALLIFLLGSPKPEEAHLQDAVDQEERRHGDILQGSFVDDYYNLTLKTISLMHWVNNTCGACKYIMKVDDDMFVNMQMVVDFSETRTFKKAVIGKLARKWRPHRDPHSKWFVPASAFNGTQYPNFATGPAYMFSGDATQALLETSLRLTPIYLEDVYMTGIVAEKAGVRRLNHALIKNVRLRVDGCTFKRFMTSHRHTPKEILAMWKLVYETSKPCEVKAAAARPAPKSVPAPPPPARPAPAKSSSLVSRPVL